MPTNNWTESKDKTTYKHKSNPSVVVLIRRNLNGDNPKWFVYHSHPAQYGRAIMQEAEGAMSMASARGKAEKHMRHWENPLLWKSDEDYGKVGKRGK